MKNTGKLDRVEQTAQDRKEKQEKKDPQKNAEVLETLDKGHGRIEKRTYFYSTDIDRMKDAKREWAKLMGIGLVLREVEHIADNKKTSEIAYYVGSVNHVNDFSKAVRMSCGAQSMHWALDVIFNDDQNRTKQAIAEQNLAIVRHMALNTIKKEKKVKPKLSNPTKRTFASVDEDYRDLLIRMTF